MTQDLFTPRGKLRTNYVVSDRKADNVTDGTLQPTQKPVQKAIYLPMMFLK